MKRLIGIILALFALTLPAQTQVLGGGSQLYVGSTQVVGGVSGDCLTVSSGLTLSQASCGSGGSLAIGSAITSSTAGYGLYVGTSGSAGLLEQFAYGANIFTALGSALNGSGAIAATTSPVFVTPNIDAATGSSLTLGVQSTSRGPLVLANTAAGAYPTTIESSNSATAASTLVLPTALAGSGPVVLTDAAGSGVLSWATPSSQATYKVGTAITASGSAVANTFYCVNPGAVLTVTLPSSPSTGQWVKLKDCTGVAATYNITVQGAAGNIDNAATYVMKVNFQANEFVYSGAQWSIN